MIEIIHHPPGAPIRAALLDFDGTLSLVRSGWQRVMRALMLETLPAGNESGAALAAEVEAAIHRLTGQATIHQMEWLATEVGRRGGNPEPAETYRRRYAERLAVHVAHRLAALECGDLAADALLVPGARALLQALRARGVLLILASGTDRDEVLREARALKIAGYFGVHVYGPGTHDPAFSKRAVIAWVLSHQCLAGPELLVIGDGPVEIAEAHAVGAVAVGVAFDEERGTGLDAFRRERLIAAGADLIVPDFVEYERLLALVEHGER